MIDKKKGIRDRREANKREFCGYYMKWPRWAPANRDVTAWEVEVEQEKNRGDFLHPPFPKGRPRHGRRIIASNSYSLVERITLQAISDPEMIYTPNESIWNCLFCSLHSGMHNRKLFIIHDNQLEALIDIVFPFLNSWILAFRKRNA